MDSDKIHRYPFNILHHESISFIIDMHNIPFVN